MIEAMIYNTKKYLPLEISTITWDGTVLNMYGDNWSFSTLSAWRISTEDRIVFGCYDDNSINLIQEIVQCRITDIFLQDNKLKIDPVFLLSNTCKLEIFSTDTFEPWTFKIKELGFFVATPAHPEAFNPNQPVGDND